MRVTFLASLAVMLRACQLPGAPEDEEMPDQVSPSSATAHIRSVVKADSTVVEESLGDDHPPAESEDHAGC
jgi:hypothetical protein